MENKYIKVTFILQPSDWHSHKTETLNAIHLGNDKYKLCNSPFYAYKYSFEDIIIAKKDELGRLLVKEKVKTGGHVTYRIYILKETDRKTAENWLKNLKEKGCSIERASQHLISVNVPPEADIHEVYKLLEDGEKKDIWGFEEADYSAREKNTK
jgi:hypothetical protein